MSKKKGLTYNEKMIAAISSLPNPLEDKRHAIYIYFENDRYRSNQNRLDHIVEYRHGLKPSDIEQIPKRIKNSTLKKDKERKNTYNLYIRRKTVKKEFIKISLEIDFEKDNSAKVKTIYITKNLK